MNSTSNNSHSPVTNAPTLAPSPSFTVLFALLATLALLLTACAPNAAPLNDDAALATPDESANATPATDTWRDRVETEEAAQRAAREALLDDPISAINIECRDDLQDGNYRGLLLYVQAETTANPRGVTKPRGRTTVQIREASEQKQIFVFERGEMLKEFTGDISTLGEFIDDETNARDMNYVIKVPASMIPKSKFDSLTRTTDANGVSYQFGRIFIDVTMNDAGNVFTDAIVPAAKSPCAIKYY